MGGGGGEGVVLQDSFFYQRFLKKMAEKWRYATGGNIVTWNTEIAREYYEDNQLMASLCYLLYYNQTSIPGLPVLAEYQSWFHFESDPFNKEFVSIKN